MSVIFGLIAGAAGLAMGVFTFINALAMWGFWGAFFSVIAFPIMFLVVPIVAWTQGEIPVYWLLLPVGILFAYLSSKTDREG